MIIIPAYDEARVIGTTESRLFAIDYPSQTLRLLGLILLMIQVSINDFIQPIFPLPLIGTWAAVVVAVLIYPRVGRKQVTWIRTEHGNLD